MSVDTTDEGFLRRQLEYATKEADRLRTHMSVTLAECWDVGKLVRVETEVFLYTKALADVDKAAGVAAYMLKSVFGSSSTNPHDNAVALDKGAAALEVLRVLVACGLSTERLGHLIAGDSRG